MISDEKKLALSCSKKTVCVTKRNKLKNYGDFYCLNCLYFFRKENKLKCHETYLKNVMKISYKIRFMASS